MSASNRTAAQVRSLFLSFFEDNGHTVARSSPLVPVDPTLLFTNAGMVQFKDIFTGKQTLPYKRAATSQKCVRAGGKHNDLDNVGRTARHHTFFEMLGNFSFGDYFKEEAILLAWQLLSKELGLPKERLMFTVFGGEGEIAPDDEARSLWQRIAEVPPERVLGLGKKDNFWMMGDTGPQGPCSEIHFHQGDDLPCQEEARGKTCLGPACDCDRWLEIWNLVFMQFERRQKDGPLLPLPAPSIDTGAGLERLSAVVQGRRSNYDTDLFTPLLSHVASACGKPYRASDDEDDVSMRVLADHSRATAFLIADGVLPGNLGRGYVMRNIMRRAIRHAMRLNLPQGYLASLCGVVVEIMSATYPELSSAKSLIDKAVNAEDEGSRETIERGQKLLHDFGGWQEQGGHKVLPGKVAFDLHSTYGFKLDLIQVVGREQGFLVDEEGFEKEMKEFKKLSTWKETGDQVAPDVYKSVFAEVGTTEFTGYGKGEAGSRGAGRVLHLLFADGTSEKEAHAGQDVELIVDRTPFYGRSGGQCGDTGRIFAAEGELLVLDTWKPVPEMIVHRARVVQGAIHVGDEVRLHVDDERRDKTRKNHSATHLLHHSLRKILGEHVTQKGSYVGPDKLTFDFSHFAPVSKDEMRAIERMVNGAVLSNYEQDTKETSFDEARKLGALALFGEKYGDRVRVLKLGESVELCGGTHVGRTGDIGLFKIVSESSVAKGIRRIEAVTGAGALELTEKVETEVYRIAELLRCATFDVANRVERLLEDIKGRDREIGKLKEKLLTGAAASSEGGLYNEEREIAGVKVVVRRLEGVDQKALREAAEKLREKLAVGVVVLGMAMPEEGKVQIVAATDRELAKDKGRSSFHANSIVAKLAPFVEGRGGGKPDLAQAGGAKVDALDNALRQTFEVLV